MRWIDAAERMPPVFTMEDPAGDFEASELLLVTDGAEMYLACYVIPVDRSPGWFTDDEELEDVTHWAYLPGLPK